MDEPHLQMRQRPSVRLGTTGDATNQSDQPTRLQACTIEAGSAGDNPAKGRLGL